MTNRTLEATPRPEAPPRFATPRPTGPTYGPAVCKIMEWLGTPPMPWQEYAADVIGEIGADGLPRWPMVLITVPRQSGKTTLMMAVCLHRMMTGPKRKIWSTAQTGKKARDKWLEMLETIQGPEFPLRPLFTAKLSQGGEKLLMMRTNSQFCPHPPTEDSLHGEQSDLNFIDEGWVFSEPEAHALLQAIEPTQATRPGAQIIIVSTMGTAASTWFHGLVDRARAGDDGIALLDWGLLPGDDSSDLEAVAARHPAYGYTIHMKAIEAAANKLAPAEFARAYGNRPTAARERYISAAAWTAAQSLTSIPPEAPVVFAAAVDFARANSSIAAAALVDGVPVIEIVDTRPGVRWLAPRLMELTERHNAPPPLLDPVGPAGTAVDALQRAGVQLPPFTVRQLTTAVAEFLDRLTAVDASGAPSPKLKIRPDDSLDFAAEVVVPRAIGDAVVWNRKGSPGSIAPLEAATLAMHALTHKPAPAAAPMIR